MLESTVTVEDGTWQSWTFPPAPESVGRARRLVYTAACPHNPRELVETAVLLASELVTNAVVHSASSFELAVRSLTGHVSVAVTDAGAGEVTALAAAASPLSEGGRGLLLVSALADAWGTEHRPGRKTVWFTIFAAGWEAGMPLEAAEGACGPDGPDGPASRSELPDRGPVWEAELLSSLFLSPMLEARLRPEDQLAELLARLVAAMAAAGAELATSGAPGLSLTSGAPGGERLEEALQICGQDYGWLRVFGSAMEPGAARAFLRVAAQRLAVTVAAYRMAVAAGSRQASQDLLADATELLSTTTTVAHVLGLTVQLCVPRLGEWAVAYAVDDRGEAHVVTVAHHDERHLDELSRAAATSPALLAAVSEATSAQAPTASPANVVVAGRAHEARVFPLVANHRPGGAIAVGCSGVFPGSQYVAATELSRRAAMALENARLHEEVAGAATALRTSLLPAALPAPAGLAFGAAYRTASRALSVGGDFYDVLSLDDGSVAMVIGDVCGKGAAAAAIARTSRDLLRLLLCDGWSTVDALRRLNRELLTTAGEDRYCSLAVVRFRPSAEGACFSVCLAGHPQPVLMAPTGAPKQIGKVGGLLGILPDDMLSLTETEVPAVAGGSVVLYTDGVTEARRGPELYGQQRLLARLRGLSAVSPQQVAEAVEASATEFSGTVLRDDLAVLVCRVVEVPQAPAP